MEEEEEEEGKLWEKAEEVMVRCCVFDEQWIDNMDLACMKSEQFVTYAVHLQWTVVLLS